MKKAFLPTIQCVACLKSEWNLQVSSENAREIREAKLKCNACGTVYPIEEGVVNMISKLSKEVAREKEHLESLDYLKDDEGKNYPINQETIQEFKEVFLSLPAGNGSYFFKPGGSFYNHARNAKRFFETLKILNLTGKEKVLEVGASFGWGAWRFAQRGCCVVALDITNYLVAAELYFSKDGAYFERVIADINRLPFCNNSFDIIFSHSVIHHCKELDKLFSEFYRILRGRGRVVALGECALGIFEGKSGKALQAAISEGFNENAYTLPHWKRSAQRGGFKDIKFHFFSFVDDYINRKIIRGVNRTFKLRLAHWVQSHRYVHQFINQLSIIPRIFFRPKGWMIIAKK